MNDIPESTAGGASRIRFGEFQPDTPTHPGEHLRVELEAQGISQADFAVRAGLSAKHVNQVIKGSASMSSDVAVVLELVLNTPATTWTSLEAHWQEARSRQRAHANLSEHLSWVRQFPLAELAKRGYLPSSRASESTVEAVLRLFRVANPGAFEDFWCAPLRGGFRRAQQFSIDEYATASWLRLAEIETESLDPPRPFSIARLRAVLPKLRELTALPILQGFLQAQELLASCGVSLAFVKAIPGSRITGATWWSALNRPLIALSDRHKRVDIFWFSLFHEVAHLMLHPRREVFIDREKGGDDQDGKEAEADDFAAEILIPRKHNKLIHSTSNREMRNLASTLGVGVCIVAGRKARLTGKWPPMSGLREIFDAAELEAARGKR